MTCNVECQASGVAPDGRRDSLLSWVRLLGWTLLGALAHPGGFPVLAPVLFVCSLLGLLQEQRRGSPVWKAFWWGTGLSFGQLIWMATPIYVGTWCLIAAPLLSMGMGLQWALWSKWAITDKRLLSLVLAGFSWALLEFSREWWLWSGLGFGSLSSVLTSFPTGALWANCFGPYGISWWIATWALMLWHQPYRVTTLLWGAIPWFYGAVFTTLVNPERSPSIWLAGVQTGFYPQVDDRGPSVAERWSALHHQLESLSAQPPASNRRLVVLPETTLRIDADLVLQTNAFPQSLDDYYAWWASRLNASVIAGIDWQEASGAHTGQGYYGSDGTRERYAKRKLVIGAEFVPYDWMQRLLHPFGITESYRPGQVSPSWRWAGLHLRPAVCYETAFAGDLREACSPNHHLVVASINDGWYGDSSLSAHHASAAQLRAIELGCPVFQVGHTGVTGLWDPFGQKLCGSTSSSAAVIMYEGPLVRVSTPWNFWGHTGWLSVGLVLSGARVLFRRRTTARTLWALPG